MLYYNILSIPLPCNIVVHMRFATAPFLPPHVCFRPNASTRPHFPSYSRALASAATPSQQHLLREFVHPDRLTAQHPHPQSETRPSTTTDIINGFIILDGGWAGTHNTQQHIRSCLNGVGCKKGCGVEDISQILRAGFLWRTM